MSAPTPETIQTDRGPEIWFSEAEERAVFRYLCTSGWIKMIARDVEGCDDKIPTDVEGVFRRVLDAFDDREHYATPRPGDDW